MKFLQDDYYGAIGDLNFALEYAPKMAIAYDKRGEAKYFLDDNFAAIDDFDKALKLDPKLADAYSNRAFAKFDLDDDERLVSFFLILFHLLNHTSFSTHNMKTWVHLILHMLFLL